MQVPPFSMMLHEAAMPFLVRLFSHGPWRHFKDFLRTYAPQQLGLD